MFRLRVAVRFGDGSRDRRLLSPDTRPPAQECRRAMLPSRRRVCPGVGARTEKLPRRSSVRIEGPRESITFLSGLYTSSHTWKTLAPRTSWLFSFRTVRQSCEESNTLLGSGIAGALGIASCVTEMSLNDEPLTRSMKRPKGATSAVVSCMYCARRRPEGPGETLRSTRREKFFAIFADSRGDSEGRERLSLRIHSPITSSDSPGLHMASFSSSWPK